MGNLGSHLVLGETSREEGNPLATQDGAHGVNGEPLPALKEKKEKQTMNNNQKKKME